ncbi:MAG: Uma2 family endonuclease, partial [Candidatus Xenobia bacterium]
METTERLYTLADMEQLHDDYELDRGRLVPMSRPKLRHARIANRIAHSLTSFLDKHPLGEVYTGDPGFILERNPDTLRGPDVAFVRQEHLAGRSEDDWYDGGPDLAVEVMSPADRPGEVLIKVGQYLDAGTRLVWRIS